jgi:hypothetical protein
LCWKFENCPYRVFGLKISKLAPLSRFWTKNRKINDFTAFLGQEIKKRRFCHIFRSKIVLFVAFLGQKTRKLSFLSHF